MLEVWKEGEYDLNSDNKLVTIITDTNFPYLDMDIYWNKRRELKFQAHLKPNQKLKYLNSDSTHLSYVFKAISK